MLLNWKRSESPDGCSASRFQSPMPGHCQSPGSPGGVHGPRLGLLLSFLLEAESVGQVRSAVGDPAGAAQRACRLAASTAVGRGPTDEPADGTGAPSAAKRLCRPHGARDNALGTWHGRPTASCCHVAPSIINLTSVQQGSRQHPDWRGGCAPAGWRHSAAAFSAAELAVTLHTSPPFHRRAALSSRA
jgi:hypothetical protein